MMTTIKEKYQNTRINARLRGKLKSTGRNYVYYFATDRAELYADSGAVLIEAELNAREAFLSPELTQDIDAYYQDGETDLMDAEFLEFSKICLGLARYESRGLRIFDRVLYDIQERIKQATNNLLAIQEWITMRPDITMDAMLENTADYIIRTAVNAVINGNMDELELLSREDSSPILWDMAMNTARAILGLEEA